MMVKCIVLGWLISAESVWPLMAGLHHLQHIGVDSLVLHSDNLAKYMKTLLRMASVSKRHCLICYGVNTCKLHWTATSCYREVSRSIWDIYCSIECAGISSIAVFDCEVPHLIFILVGKEEMGKAIWRGRLSALVRCESNLISWV